MRFSRWLVPATIVVTIAGGVAVSSASAGGSPVVPDRTAAQVLASVATSNVSALSGTVSTRADLGLPGLPTSIGGSQGGHGDGSAGSAADPGAVALRLLTGRTTLRVWIDGPQRQRVQLLDDFSEVAFVRNGRDVWTFDTNRSAGTHVVLPDEAALDAHAGRRGAGGTPSDRLGSDPLAATPDALAREVIARLDPTTEVTLDAPQTVAGRAAYTLVVAPRTDATLVDRAVLAVDAANGMPLRVQVYARGTADPVLESGFSAVDFSRPDAGRFAFTPPAGADITTRTVPPPGAGTPDSGAATPDSVTPKRSHAQGDAGAHAGTRVIGSGWSAVVETRPAASGAPSGTATMLDDPLVQQLTTRVSGGRALRTALFSVLLTDDGRVLVGAVPVEALVSAAG